MFGKKKKEDKLSLSGLTSPQFDPELTRKRLAEIDARRVEYRKKYGIRATEMMARDDGLLVDYDTRKKVMNTAIYNGHIVIYNGHIVHGTDGGLSLMTFDKYRREVLGDMYDVLKECVSGDLRVCEILLKRAIDTGLWEELPDELQAEYHRRVGN